MATVNYTDPTLDRTVRVFDEFYNFAIEVDANTYDMVYSYFASVFDDTLAAKNFTVTFFQVAQNTGTSIQDLLQEIQGQSALQLTSTLCYYLNNLRSNSTLLGVSAKVVPNAYAARNVQP